MSFREFLDGFHAARNRQSGLTGSSEQAWGPQGCGEGCRWGRQDREPLCQAAVEFAIVKDQLARVVADRDEARQRIGELEGILRFPGVKKGLLKAVHPDMHPQANERERRALDDICKIVVAVFDRLQARS